MRELEAEEKKYNDEILNDNIMDASAVYRISFERLSTPDMLQDLSADMQERIGMSKSYLAWRSSVNS